MFYHLTSSLTTYGMYFIFYLTLSQAGQATQVLPTKGKSVTSMLPITELNPNNMNCIYSTLHFIESQARYLEIVTPVVTLDLVDEGN